MAGRALVLGGGGLAGIAWETGMLLGLEREGIDLRDADILVGTSAGSVVAAQVANTTPLLELYEAQRAGFVGEKAASLGVRGILRMVLTVRFASDDADGFRKLGARAAATQTVSVAERRAVIEQRLPVHAWPDRDVRITAIDIDTGLLEVFTRDSGVSLVDAVSASCAVPLVWPVVPIDMSTGPRRFMDGGMRSPSNADLAADADRVVVIAPQPHGLRKGASAKDQLASLTGRSALVTPDADAQRAMGRNALDPAIRRPSAEAGLAQAARVAEQVRAVWS